MRRFQFDYDTHRLHRLTHRCETIHKLKYYRLTIDVEHRLTHATHIVSRTQVHRLTDASSNRLTNANSNSLTKASSNRLTYASSSSHKRIVSHMQVRRTASSHTCKFVKRHRLTHASSSNGIVSHTKHIVSRTTVVQLCCVGRGVDRAVSRRGARGLPSRDTARDGVGCGRAPFLRPGCPFALSEAWATASDSEGSPRTRHSMLWPQC